MLSFLILNSFGGDSLLPFAFFIDDSFMVATPNPMVLPVLLLLLMEPLAELFILMEALLLHPDDEVDDVNALPVADVPPLVIDNGIVMYCCPLSENIYANLKFIK